MSGVGVVGWLVVEGLSLGGVKTTLWWAGGAEMLENKRFVYLMVCLVVVVVSLGGVKTTLWQVEGAVWLNLWVARGTLGPGRCGHWGASLFKI